jgi:uncharacterized protein (TIGR02271 family)
VTAAPVAESSAIGRGEELVIPIVAEELDVSTRFTERVALRITKTVSERIETIDVPLMEERIEVDRVVVNRQVDTVPQVRYEGDVMIVPVVEEVLVTEKRLMLREELHIRKSQVVVSRRHEVSLRREEVHVESLGRDNPTPRVDEVK